MNKSQIKKMLHGGKRTMKVAYTNRSGDFITTATELTRGGYTMLVSVRCGADGKTPEGVELGLLKLPRSLTDAQRRQMHRYLEKAAKRFVSKVLDVRGNA